MDPPKKKLPIYRGDTTEFFKKFASAGNSTKTMEGSNVSVDDIYNEAIKDETKEDHK